MQVLCLFSVVNDYNQPKNNLVAFWHDIPTDQELGVTIAEHQGYDRDGNYAATFHQYGEFVSFKESWQGRISDIEYRLRWVEPGRSITSQDY
jgi:hypothetical protein